MPIPALQPAWTAEAVERFAGAVGGRVRVDGWGPAIDVGADALPADRAVVAPLSDVGLLEVAGADAVAFLHAQLTNDVEHLGAGEARWAGYCSAKGRLLSTMRYWRGPSAIRLTASRPLAAPLARRLSMFVLRAKARVTDASDAVVVFGVAGDAALDAAAAIAGVPPPSAGAGTSAGADASAGSAAVAAAAPAGAADTAACGVGGDLVGLPPLPADVAADRVLPRALLVVPADRAPAAWARLCDAAAPVSGAAWRRTEVRAAIPRIVADTVEAFVPQMLNLESSGGVDFRKGCYPGQEVVARSQYLGRLKRRMFVFRGDGAVPAPGVDVLPASGGEPCGQVVLAAPDGAGGFEALVESQVAAVEAGGLRVGDATLAPLALPYALKAID